MTVYQESAWTAPSPWCPHPERWSSTDPQSTEIQVSELVSGFVRALQPDYVVETGTCLGQTTWMVGLALQANGHGRLDSFEINPELVTQAAERCGGLPVTVHCLSSLEFTPAETIGFAWFDSLLDLRIPEFNRYREWMVPGTICGFHDTGPQFGGFSDQLDALPGVRPIRLRTPRGVTFVEVL